MAADRKRWKIEQRLGVAIRKLEDNAQDAEEHRASLQQAADAREQVRQSAEQVAMERYFAAQREEALLQLVGRHTTARQIREFVVHAEAVELGQGVLGWLNWAQDYAEQLDPLSGGFTVPQIASPSLKDLAPYWPPDTTAK